MKKNIFLYFLIIDLLIVNLAVLTLYLNTKKAPILSNETDYKTYVDSQVDNIKKYLVNITPSPSLTLVPTPTSSPTKNVTSKQTSVSYIPIPGSGQTLNNQWTDLFGTEFYFATQDFSGLKKAYFEANFKLLNGNGKAYLRLFDITSGIEIWGSQIEISSQQNVMVSSSEITFRPGNHLIRVQAKSLTADTTVFTSGRLKIIIEK